MTGNEKVPGAKTDLPEQESVRNAGTEVGRIGEEQCREWTKLLEKYKAGKAHLESRVKAGENWWKLRNTTEERKNQWIAGDGGFHSRSGWLHNVIVSKHADAMDAYPSPTILPREQGDQAEAERLSAIVPCVLEQNDFEETYSRAMWTKLKSGTGIYKVMWDASRLNGLGDIAIEPVDVLNLFWEPGVNDIQRSRNVFHVELMDKDAVEELFPQTKGKLSGKSFVTASYSYDDHVDTSDKASVIEVYYRKNVGGRKVLHYCKYVDNIVLYASENDPEKAERGMYDHGLFPFVFDALFPIEGSPCGYGFVDLCSAPQTEIDLMKTAFVKNTLAGATPRYFERQDGAINEDEFLDLSKTIIHVDGNLGEDSIRSVANNGLDGNYIDFLNVTINELRETSGNTETATGTAGSGVTAASAIAALQEASGKGSKDASRSAYRAYSEIVRMVIELIRQFYDMPRSFRIVGAYGMARFVEYSNEALQPQALGSDFGVDAGYRMPVFDIKVGAQKQSAYTSISQNELALQFFQLGFFNPQLTDQAMMCLDIMDFDGKDEVQQKVAQNGTLRQKLIEYQQLALALAQKYQPELVQGLAQDAMGGASSAVRSSGGKTSLPEIDHMEGIEKQETTRVQNARAQSQQASQPEGGRVIAQRD